MSLDIRFVARRPVICPRCGEVVMKVDVNEANSGGSGWYPILETFGYYVPYEQRTEENDWYGKPMDLTQQQANEVYQYVKQNPGLYEAQSILGLIASAICDKDEIVVTADW